MLKKKLYSKLTNLQIPANSDWSLNSGIVWIIAVYTIGILNGIEYTASTNQNAERGKKCQNSVQDRAIDTTFKK